MAELDVAFSGNLIHTVPIENPPYWPFTQTCMCGGKCNQYTPTIGMCKHTIPNGTIWSGATNYVEPVPSITMKVNDSETRELAKRYGLQYTTVAWEDTGRTKGSAFGPNISDMTLVVRGTPQPILRKPNFEDVTSDQPLDSFSVNVGNENGTPLHAIPLREYLKNITKYTDVKLKGSLLADRDSHVLTSAQACILPLKDGNVEFGVNLYNYQSRVEPAVLVIIASAQGTSAHFVLGRTNTLNFNKTGKIAKFIAMRLEDDRKRRGVSAAGEMTTDEKLQNALLIFQIPLKYKAPADGFFSKGATLSSQPRGSLSFSSAVKEVFRSASYRGMDHAIISTTEGEGRFESLSSHSIERDDRMPIRCTIQYYHVTDGTMTDDDMQKISVQVTKHKPAGSLVVEGETRRPTEHLVSARQGGASLFGDL